jgi:hypothetical protein
MSLMVEALVSLAMKADLESEWPLVVLVVLSLPEPLVSSIPA